MNTLEPQAQPDGLHPNLPLGPVAAVLLTLSSTSISAAFVSIPALVGGLSADVDPATGAYRVTSRKPAWTLAGSLATPLTNTTAGRGKDGLGPFQQVMFCWHEGKIPMTGEIRLYEEKALALFTQTCGTTMESPPKAFPCFTQVPAGLYAFSHSLKEFCPPQFKANEICTPWLLFDDKANALIISPASHFMLASMLGDGRQQVASGFSPQLRNVPAGFTQQTLLAFGNGINATWDVWGRAMLDLQGAKRPAYDADVILKYLGYWTDNGASYYYNYDLDKGYAGTLRALVEHYRARQIPLRYLQLDSWWYSKSTTGADGQPGKPKKAEKLPSGEWNRYGGTLEYRAHKDLFPEGLGAFQKSIGLPLVTHSRWIDPASPYHQRYKISGLAPVDPKWWDDIAAYMKASGIITYEQDWLDRIYDYSPALRSDVGVGEAFLDNMARACKAQGITLQYCMPYAAHFLQGCRYDNLTTIRACTDRFSPKRWNDFLYVSRLAASLGMWPWSDVYPSTEVANVLLSTLSAGPVGIGDAIGAETMTNLERAVRMDGVIVKPDRPIVPLDQCYLTDAREQPAPLVASTRTEHGDTKTEYLFAFIRPKTPAGDVRFTPAELGLNGPAYIHGYFSGSGRRLEPSDAFTTHLKRGTNVFYVVAPIGKSGIAFLGDRGKFVGTGKQRIASLNDEPGKLSVNLVFAEQEKSVVLHGYAAAAPRVNVQAGKAGDVKYDPGTQYFSVEVGPDASAPVDRSGGDPVRHVAVVLTAVN